MLRPRWINDHLDDFDLCHIHFGFDATTPQTLSAAIEILKRAGKPLVYTAHDLRNPHHANRRAHEAHLDILMAAADEVITLTPGAAQAIRQRWGRTATVLPHPHVLELDALFHPSGRRQAGDRFVVGVHAKSVRASMDPVAVIESLARIIQALPGAELRINVHREVLHAGGPTYHAELARCLREAASQPQVAIHVHDFFNDAQFWNYLRDLSVSVLPYRFGTHSGWLEACHDLGTTVVAPTCGFYAEQRPCYSYRHDESGLDEDSLAQAVLAAYRDRPSWIAKPEDRLAERLVVATEHRVMYQRLLA